MTAESSLTPSSDVLAELRPSSSTEVPLDEVGRGAEVVVADFVSEASSSPDDPEEVEGKVLIGAEDDDAGVLSLSVELPLVYELPPRESSDPALVDEPNAVELVCGCDDWVPEELTRVADAAVVGECSPSPLGLERTSLLESALRFEGSQCESPDSAYRTEGEKTAKGLDAKAESMGWVVGNACPTDDGIPFSRQRSSSHSRQSATGRIRRVLDVARRTEGLPQLMRTENDTDRLEATQLIPKGG